jgi:hypothetical protein
VLNSPLVTRKERCVLSILGGTKKLPSALVNIEMCPGGGCGGGEGRVIRVSGGDGHIFGEGGCKGGGGNLGASFGGTKDCV